MILFSPLLCVLFALAIIGFTGWNLYKDRNAFQRTYARFLGSQNGEFSLRQANGKGADWALWLRNTLPQARSCFLWTVPHWRDMTHVSQRAAELQYQIFPLAVRFRSDEQMKKCDCILIEKALRREFDAYLEKSSLSEIFQLAGENKNEMLYAQKRLAQTPALMQQIK